MNPEIFAEWLRRQGHRVVRTESSYWFDASWKTYQAFPYHWLIQPSEQELRTFIRKNHVLGLRYSSPVDTGNGRISYHAVYDGPCYDLNVLDRRTRQNVRTGLNRCRVAPIPLERLAEEGWDLELDTAHRQHRQAKIGKEAWRRRYLSAVDLAGFEAWGALIEDRLVASLLSFRSENCCELISQQCHRDFISARVNHALTFTVTQTMMSRSGISSIFYTLQSLDAPPSVDEFKFRMGYSAKPVRQRVVFHPLLAPAIAPAWFRIVQGLMKLNPENPVLTKAVGMLKFYLEGRRPLQEQNWPECLVQRAGTTVAQP